MSEEVKEDIDKWTWYKNVENVINLAMTMLPTILELLQEIKKLLESIDTKTTSP